MKVDRSILANNDQQIGKVADPDKIESSIEHLAYVIDQNDDIKTEKYGDHPGTWQGLRPSDIGSESINASRLDLIERDYAKKQVDYWHDAVFQNFWINASGYKTAYLKDNLGKVHLKGAVAAGTTTPGTVLFTLPAGYRPPEPVTMDVLATDINGTVLGQSGITISGNGNVLFYGGSSPNKIFLGGISFHVI